MLVGLLSLGALLAPTVVAALIALVVTRLGAIAQGQTNRNRVSKGVQLTIPPSDARVAVVVRAASGEVPDRNQRC